MAYSKKRSKGAAEKEVIECIQEKGKSAKEIEKETGISPQTIYDIFKRLDKKNLVEIKEIFDKKGNKTKKYRYLLTEDFVNPKTLEFLMNRYEKALKENNPIRRLLLEDLTRTCLYGKILDRNFIKFLIKHAKKEDFYNICFIDCLSKIAEKFKEEIKWNKGEDFVTIKELQKEINDSTDFVYTYVFNKNLNIDLRVGIFEMLPNFDWKKTMDTTFLLYDRLNNTDKLKVEEYKKDKVRKNHTEFDFFKLSLKRMILRYSKVNYIDCRDRLYNALEKEILDETIKSELYNLWAFTNIGFEEENKQSRFQFINPNDSIELRKSKEIIKEKGINIDE